jgi:multiple sugar transport system permease protein
MSLTDIKSRDLRSPFAVGFVGLENYAHILGDSSFRQSAYNTAYFVIIGVPLTLGIALAAAMALDKGITRFRTLFRVGYYTPVVTSIVAVAVVWRFLLRQDVGLFNTILGWVGIHGPDWLGSTTWAMPSLIAMASWRNFGTAMIIFLAGLQSVPVMLQEAAAIDGASSWQRFRHITLPLLRPTMLFVMVTTTIGYVQFFEEPFVMTNGGPLDSTKSMSMFTYEQFGFGNYGFASAAGYVLFVIIVALSAMQFRFFRSNT